MSLKPPPGIRILSFWLSMLGALNQIQAADEFPLNVETAQASPFSHRTGTFQQQYAAEEDAGTPTFSETSFTQSGSTEELTQRIRELEAQVNGLNTRVDQQLLPGLKRSTDIAPPPSSPAFPKVKLTGFFQADAGFFSQNTASIQQLGGIDQSDVRGFRRARLAAVGDVSDYVSYLLEMDFAFPGRPSFMDVWLDVHQVPLLGNVRVGQWRQPFGMDELTSVRELMFLERAVPFAFAPFRQTGIGFHDNNADQTVTWAASVYGFPTDAFGGSVGDSGYGMASRITNLAWYENDGQCLLHLGFDYALNMPSNRSVVFRNNPEFGGPFGGPTGVAPDVAFTVNTGAIPNTTSVNLLNGEVAAVLGSMYAQSEVRYAIVNAGGQSLVFPSAYAQAAWILTGEVRPCNKLAGVLGRIKPARSWGEDGGWGALEVAARYSYINLNQGGFTGGEQNDVTLGMNWYLNQYTKFQVNYIRSMVNRAPATSTGNMDIICMRAQLDF